MTLKKNGGGELRDWSSPINADKSDQMTTRMNTLKDSFGGAPAEKRLSWLRSQIIGYDSEFESPFGRRRITYADHTASGRSVYYIENFITHSVLPFYGNTHTCNNYVGSQTTRLTHEASEYVKKRLGGGPNDAVLFCGSGTTTSIKKLQEVIGVAAPSKFRDRLLKVMEDEERWIVFIGPYEHHSNLLSWRQSLAEVIEIGLDENGLLDIEELGTLLKKLQYVNRPMLGSFSACSNVTGILTDTRKLAKLLHQYGAFACFDFAASGPYVEIDIRSGEIDGYDAIFLSPHKFLGGPGTSGVLLMSKALYQLNSSPPSTCGGGTVNYVNGFSEKDTLYVEDIEERENAGTPPIVQNIRTALAFWVKEYIGHQIIAKRETNFIHKALERLLPHPNIVILGNTTSKNRLGILSFIIISTNNSSTQRKQKEYQDLKEFRSDMDKPLHGAFVAKLLNDLFGIQARGGCACAGPYGHSLLNVDRNHSLVIRSKIKEGYHGVKPGWTRVSFPYYTRIKEFEFILTAIEFIANYGQRFLPLYSYDWKFSEWTVLQETKSKTDCVQNKEVKDVVSRGSNLSHAINTRNELKSLDPKVDTAIKQYASYLSIANEIANVLPKCPDERAAPMGIDLSTVDFRV